MKGKEGLEIERIHGPPRRAQQWHQSTILSLRFQSKHEHAHPFTGSKASSVSKPTLQEILKRTQYYKIERVHYATQDQIKVGTDCDDDDDTNDGPVVHHISTVWRNESSGAWLDHSVVNRFNGRLITADFTDKADVNAALDSTNCWAEKKTRGVITHLSIPRNWTGKPWFLQHLVIQRHLEGRF